MTFSRHWSFTAQGDIKPWLQLWQNQHSLTHASPSVSQCDSPNQPAMLKETHVPSTGHLWNAKTPTHPGQLEKRSPFLNSSLVLFDIFCVLQCSTDISLSCSLWMHFFLKCILENVLLLTEGERKCACWQTYHLTWAPSSDTSHSNSTRSPFITIWSSRLRTITIGGSEGREK